MADLVTELRMGKDWWHDGECLHPVKQAAADEIERLRDLVDRQQAIIDAIKMRPEASPITDTRGSDE